VALAQAEPFTAAFVIWLIRLGDWIRDRTGAASHRAIANLLAATHGKRRRES